MTLFTIFLVYNGDTEPRKVADGCNKEQVFNILSRSLFLAEVAYFLIVPLDYYVPFKEYTL